MPSLRTTMVFRLLLVLAVASLQVNASMIRASDAVSERSKQPMEQFTKAAEVDPAHRDLIEENLGKADHDFLGSGMSPHAAVFGIVCIVGFVAMVAVVVYNSLQRPAREEDDMLSEQLLHASTAPENYGSVVIQSCNGEGPYEPHVVDLDESTLHANPLHTGYQEK